MLEEARDTGEIIERVAALDIGKAELVCCVRVPDADKPGRRLQEVTPYSTMTRSLLLMADRLRGLGVTRVVMEATSVYWKAPFYLLEAAGSRSGWSTPKTSNIYPGGPRPTSSTPSGCARSPNGRWSGRVPFPPEIRRLRDLTRYGPAWSSPTTPRSSG